MTGDNHGQTITLDGEEYFPAPCSNDDLTYTTINNVEMERAMRWQRDHLKEKHSDLNINQWNMHTFVEGSHFGWKIVPNGIGPTVAHFCCYCGAEHDVTDVDKF